MGKHSKPHAGYLPRVAAGAAPLALLLAGPATAWAAEPALPLDHQHSGSLDKGLESGSTAGTTFHKEFLTTTNHDADTIRLGETGSVQKFTNTAQHLESSNSRKDFLSLAPNPAGVASEETHRLLATGSRYDAARLPHDADLVNQTSERPEIGFARNTVLTGDDKGDGHALSALDGSGALGRSSGQAMDFGDTADAGTSSQQYGRGAFTGLLDLTRSADGTIGSAGGQGANTAFDQTHAIGGHAGQLSGTTSSAQSGKLGCHGAFQGTLAPDGKPGGGVTQQGDAAVSHATSGDLGVDHVLRVSGDLKSAASFSGDLTGRSGSFAHENDLRIQAFDRAPVGGELKISGPPLTITPR